MLLNNCGYSHTYLHSQMYMYDYKNCKDLCTIPVIVNNLCRIVECTIVHVESVFFLNIFQNKKKLREINSVLGSFTE